VTVSPPRTSSPDLWAILVIRDHPGAPYLGGKTRSFRQSHKLPICARSGRWETRLSDRWRQTWHRSTSGFVHVCGGSRIA
jgi:hypothetical protein